MLLPIKAKKRNFYSLFFKKNPGLRGLFSKDITEFNDSISIIRIGKFFKTSTFNRFKQTEKYLIDCKKSFNNICDIGSSDGLSSINFINNLKYNKYVLIDRYVNLKIHMDKRNVYLYDNKLNLHMLETENLVIYFDPLNQNKNIFNSLISLFFYKKPKNDLIDIECINPVVKKLHKNIEIIEADLMENFETKIKYDLIIIENLINKIHNNQKMINKLKKNIMNMVSNDAFLILGENNLQENATIYRYEDNFKILHRIGIGSESEKNLNLC